MIAAEWSCESCGAPALPRLLLFRQNISYLFARREALFHGRLCRRCAGKICARFTLTTLLLTWFGIVGVLVGPIYIVQNLWQLAAGLTASPSSEGLWTIVRQI